MCNALRGKSPLAFRSILSQEKLKMEEERMNKRSYENADLVRKRKEESDFKVEVISRRSEVDDFLANKELIKERKQLIEEKRLDRIHQKATSESLMNSRKSTGSQVWSPSRKKACTYNEDIYKVKAKNTKIRALVRKKSSVTPKQIKYATDLLNKLDKDQFEEVVSHINTMLSLKAPIGYISILNGECKIHSTWDSCKSLVHRKKGAKFHGVYEDGIHILWLKKNGHNNDEILKKLSRLSA